MMPDDYRQFEKRKQDHLELALMPSNQATELNIFDHIELKHEALPDLNLNELSLDSSRFGKKIPTPFFVSSMTAGHQQAFNINSRLLEACVESKWAMGVGSQRRELTDKDAALEWKTLRRQFPQVSLYSNLGIAQLIHTPFPQIQALVDALEAEALIIHCNPLQEAIQPEGTPQFKGCWQALATLVKCAPVPIIVKETGCGFSSSTLQKLNEIGVAAVDVSGLGGTHWGRIEGHRAAKGSLQQQAARSFHNWGITTVHAVENAVALKPSFEVWGSGGLRHGLDAAKLLALGATSIGFAKPLLAAALQNAQEVYQLMSTIEYELKIAMFCTGSAVITELKEKLCR